MPGPHEIPSGDNFADWGRGSRFQDRHGDGKGR